MVDGRQLRELDVEFFSSNSTRILQRLHVIRQMESVCLPSQCCSSEDDAFLSKPSQCQHFIGCQSAACQ